MSGLADQVPVTQREGRRQVKSSDELTSHVRHEVRREACFVLVNIGNLTSQSNSQGEGARISSQFHNMPRAAEVFGQILSDLVDYT